MGFELDYQGATYSLSVPGEDYYATIDDLAGRFVESSNKPAEEFEQIWKDAKKGRASQRELDKCLEPFTQQAPEFLANLHPVPAHSVQATPVHQVDNLDRHLLVFFGASLTNDLKLLPQERHQVLELS